MKSSEVFGIHAVSSWLTNHPHKAVKLLVKAGSRSSRVNNLLRQAQEVGCSIEEVSPGELDRLVPGPHQGVILKIEAVAELSEKSLDALLEDLAGKGKADHPMLLVILDGVTDPRNLGACLRSAAAAKVDAVIVPKRNSADLSPVAIKAASGGSELVPLYRVTNLGRTIDKLKASGVWITGAMPDTALNLSEVDLTGNTALVLGSEDEGIRQGVQKRCDFLASIPMPRASFSLNVSVATGIVLYEVIRQRKAGASRGCHG